MENENYEEIKSKTFKFGAVGDYLKGTLTDIAKTQVADSYGKLSHIYSVRALEGSFIGSTKSEKTKKFTLDEAPTIVKKDEDFTFFISNDKGVVISAMKDIKIGQKFMVKFIESKPTVKGNDVKIIKVFAGKDAQGLPLMDQVYFDSLKEGISEFDSKAETM